MTNSPRARILINPSAVLYEQSAAQPSLPAEVGNIDLNFVPSVAFIPNVYIADSLRARTPINLSAVLYEQAAARTSLPAEVGNISPRARTLINPSAVLYEQADARSGLSAKVSIIDLNFVPSVAFDAMGNVELTGDLLGDNNNVHREFSSIYVLRSVDKIQANVANVFDTVVSKSDEVPTREPSSYIKTELYLHQKQALYFIRKFYRLVITGEDTHYKQTIKKAYIMSLERALLILFMI
ncbi:hypothetical protein HBH90_066480 [Parastagonospora nodorum]|nr:hypothetical protein HBI02_057110 [Parastagonospora nodorum]KAH4471260.1 hypothetical protein HBH90_066480 [Parastagonospora nodorum]KAH4503267.1 hypothetical protein HBH88_065410 [Parastagonospora nodorum]KAH4642837.1 hypothetical protein HBH80_246130 [Parastagonospora nodorum]KAH4833918.1 hypothetical protein HBH60_046520 [Parastagonospora nodorum]